MLCNIFAERISISELKETPIISMVLLVQFLQNTIHYSSQRSLLVILGGCLNEQVTLVQF